MAIIKVETSVLEKTRQKIRRIVYHIHSVKSLVYVYYELCVQHHLGHVLSNPVLTKPPDTKRIHKRLSTRHHLPLVSN